MTRVLVFLFCGVIWGSSYFWIKVALEEIGPVTLVAYRLLLATAGMVVVFLARKVRPPRDLRTIGHLALLAMLSPGLPFILISWSETRIDSGLAAILNGTVPLLTTLSAHFFLADEPLTGAKVLGLITGFTGIITLFSRDLGLGLFSGSGLGQLAMLGSSVLYALSSVYSRQLLRRLSPMIVTMGQMLFADLLAWALVPMLEPGAVVPHRALTWVALAWMGLLGSCLTFLSYHWLVTHWGASRSALTNYIVPVVGLALGLFLRGERADWRLVVGAGLILSGVAIVNWRALAAVALKERGRRERRL
jgi:drug/metabolite transporter (DMT)-like permease